MESFELGEELIDRNRPRRPKSLCKPLLGEAVEALVNIKINTEVANRKANHEETRIRPVPPSEG